MTRGKKGRSLSPLPHQLNLPLLQQTLAEVESLKRENQELRTEIAKLSRQIMALSQNSRLDTIATSSAPVVPNSNRSPDRGFTPIFNPGTVEPGAFNAGAFDIPDTLTQNGKTALFRRLFVGRQDVYAVRWQSDATGKSGYQPARNHDYISHRYDPARKRKICGDNCPHLPLSDKVLADHLEGKHTIGTYPLLQDETCPFLCIDLDEEGWQDDARSLLRSGELLGIPAYLERSRSGEGGHLWIFFERPLPASLARKLGDALITKSNQGPQPLSLQSYDRMFPNQDTMPAFGYGNLIALPLQKYPLSQGNSAFLDHNMMPYADQWELLKSIRKIDVATVEHIVGEAARQNALMSVARPREDSDTASSDNPDPWSLLPSRRKYGDTLLQRPFPAMFKITLGNFVYIEKKGLSKTHLNRFTRLAAFQNPQFFANQALRLSTYNIPRIICCAENFPQHLCLPRGCLDDLIELLKNSSAQYTIADQRFSGKQIQAKFTGELRHEQLAAAQELLEHDTGVLAAATGTGKTVVAAYCIAKRTTNTLVLVHRRQLLEQWKSQLAAFLDVSPESIGQIGGGKNQPSGIIDVATIQSLCLKGEVNNIVAEYGQVIVDECHHIGAVSFEKVLRQIKAKFVLGLTATPTRKDGHHPIVVMQCGPIRYRVRHKDYASGIKKHLVLPRLTQAKLAGIAEKFNTQEIISQLASDEMRNKMIAEDVLKSLAEGRTPLVLTERTQHLQLLAKELEGTVKNLFVFRGGLGKRQINELRRKLEAVPQEEQRVVLATGKYIGEGFDDSRLDTLFLAMPISWRGTLEQYAGRLHRAHQGKSMVQIYDYVDIEIEKLYRMFKKRQLGYKKIGYKIFITSNEI